MSTPSREVRVRSIGGVATLLIDDEAVELTAGSGEDRGAVERAVSDAGRTLHHLLDVDGDTVTVRSLPFDAVLDLPSTLAVDEEGVERLQLLGAPSEPDGAVAWLRQRLLVDRHVPTAIVSAGSEQLDAVAAMTLVGSDLQVDVRLIDGLWRIYSATSKRRRPRRLDLVTGLIISTESYASRLEATAAEEAERLIGTTRYFGAWKEYAEIEHRKAIEDARSLGSARYTSYRANEDGSYTFTLEPGAGSKRLVHTLTEGPAELEVGRTLPGATTEPRSRAVMGGRGSLAPQRGDDVRVTVSAEGGDQHPPKTGYIFGAERGDTIRHERRLDALQRPLESPRRAAQILLDGGDPPAEGRRRLIDARRSKAAMEAFGGLPTGAQLAALDAALNTPDIALIQGPPGTGKTRVIAALRAVLGERSNSTGREAALDRILVSAEQHDAVSHAISVRAPSRLPAVKLGSRRGAVDDNSHLLQWAHELRARLEADLSANAALQTLELAAKANDFIDGARGGRFARQEVHEAIRYLTTEARTLLTADTTSQLVGYLVGESTLAATAMAKGDAASVDRIARRLRSDRDAFLDDGQQELRHIRPELERLSLLTVKDARLLDTLVAGHEPSLADLRRIQAIRERILDTCATVLRATEDGSLPRGLDRLLLQAKGDVQRRLDADDLRVPRVVHRLIQRLKDSPGAVRASLERHTSVFGATCQQVLGAEMRRAQEEEISFDSVIIDEAARANPLDLLIPLSMARRRAVLVGDHRQLPQLLDPEVIARIVEARDDSEQRRESAALLERSLFERLFSALRRPGAVTRTVTLDRQYRMHPVMGSLINEFFYEPHGETISNGVTAEERDPSWTGSTHPLQWIDVPAAAGRTERAASGSWVRGCEARSAADLLVGLLASSPTHTVGVISFYRAQVAEVWGSLVERDLARRTDDGEFQVANSWTEAFGEAGTPRFLIGTVDAFQGREFDAVILSTVRSGNGYGFLQVENRLCVAMSRARHALITVGDRQHFRGSEASRRVPALHAVASRAEIRP